MFLVFLASLLSPRLALALVWIFSDRIGEVFDGLLVPVIGLLVAPWTTLAYALVWSADGLGVYGWFVVATALLVDVGSHAGAARTR